MICICMGTFLRKSPNPLLINLKNKKEPGYAQFTVSLALQWNLP